MNIGTSSAAVSSMPTSTAVGMAVMKMSKENFEQQGQALVQLLDTSVVQPIGHSGSTVDIKL